VTAGDRELGIDRPQVAFAAVVGERHVQVGGEGQDLGFPVAEAFEQAAGCTMMPILAVAEAYKPVRGDAL
jgi:hypothetical protein